MRICHGSMMVQIGVPFIWMVSVEAHESLKWPKSAKSGVWRYLEVLSSFLADTNLHVSVFCILEYK